MAQPKNEVRRGAPELTTAATMRDVAISSRAEALTPVLTSALALCRAAADAGALVAAVPLTGVPGELHDVLGAALEKLGYKVYRATGVATFKVRW